MKHKRTSLLSLLALTVLATLLVGAPQNHGAHASPTVVTTVSVDSLYPDVGVNASTDRVYVANSGIDTVSVIDGASNAAIATTGQCFRSGGPIALEGEDGTGDGAVMERGAASKQKTVWLHNGESRTLSFDLDGTARYEVVVRYSNDGPPDTVQVSIDGTIIGQCTSQDTRSPGGVPGSGWNVFFSCEPLGPAILSPGQHELVVSAETDFYGVEIDVVSLSPIAYPEATPPVAAPELLPAADYWLVASDGGIFTFGDAGFHGSTGDIALSQPIGGMAATPSGNGYWLVASDGGVFSCGDAGFFGSTGAIALNQPIVGMAATPSGNGYWLVASDGGVFSCGDAGLHGSTGAIALNQPIVGMATTPSVNGYWLVASDGGIFSFGDALFYGSTGNIALNQPIVGMAATPSGNGYWLVASDGGIFSFGDADFYGSTGAIALNQPIVGMAATPSGNGYWLVASDGGIFSFGDADFFGSTGNITLNQPIVGMSAD